MHCDTLLKLYSQSESIKENNLHISLKKANSFSPYVQVSAIWSDDSLSNDEAYTSYNKVLKYAKKQIKFSTNLKTIENYNFILAVEDARILNGDLFRLDKLFNDGVRILTLNWKGQSVIGGGWDTTAGLTDFGKKVVESCFNYGIIPDISHSSIYTVDDVLFLADSYKKPVIASHSNAYSICNHKRNISTEHFKWLIKNDSILGISLASEHLTNSYQANIDDIIRHIDYFLTLGGENTICLGCDFDGVTTLPKKINSITDLTLLHNEASKAFGEAITKKIFFTNAYNFMSKNLIN